MKRVLAVLFIALFVLALGANTVSAAVSATYIRINNGNTISITGTERPQIVVQFGNTGASFYNVRVRCTWDRFIRFTGDAQRGPFNGFEFVPPPPAPFLFFPARNVTSGALLPDLKTGQNYNVAFNIRLALPNAGFKGYAGQLQCTLHDTNFNLLARSNTTYVYVH